MSMQQGLKRNHKNTKQHPYLYLEVIDKTIDLTLCKNPIPEDIIISKTCINRKMRKKILKIAKKNSQNSTYKKKLGAVIVNGSAVIGTGHNQKKPRRIRDGYYSTHAECAALSRAKSVRGCDMYVFRSLANGLPAMAKPCDLCQLVLKNEGIKKVFYTTNSPPFWKEMRLN